MKPELSRREFIKSAAVSATTFTILQAGSARTYAANEKLNIASVGAGGQAGGDIMSLSSENIVGLCDVDWRRAAGMFKRFPKARQFKDYREMFDVLEKEIDAVIVGTPDHHHFHASLYALKRGKHVYCEKPLTHSVWEARELTKAAGAANVATQMGNQAQASEETRRLQEFILEDAIGPVRKVHVWTDRPSRGLFDEYWPQGVSRPSDTPPVPDTLDWNLWLGPAPERPYHPAYLPTKWRGWRDFGTGALGDIACHYLDPVFRALKLHAPISIEASSTRVNKETFPLGSMITYNFAARDPMPPVELVWYDGGLRPPRPDELKDNDLMGDNGLLLVGERGILLSDWRRWRLYPDELATQFGEPAKSLPRSPGHHQEFINACKGGPPAGSNFDWAGPLTESVLLGNIPLRVELREELTKVQLKWDTDKFAFSNHAGANQFLRRDYRKGWEV
jgi:predicted dehydrogenase